MWSYHCQEFAMQTVVYKVNFISSGSSDLSDIGFLKRINFVLHNFSWAKSMLWSQSKTASLVGWKAMEIFATLAVWTNNKEVKIYYLPLLESNMPNSWLHVKNPASPNLSKESQIVALSTWLLSIAFVLQNEMS